MKNLKKVLALVLAVVMIMGTVAVASAKDYKDVKSADNYAEAIDILSSLGILDGFEDGTFKADGRLTRAQAAKIVAIVHNAATTGAIKGQDEVSALYANAQNSFVDCNDNWALPFINYCRIVGLADGMTKTTYAPNRQLTGVQWLKLMLTTLNFDTAKEGYTGTGWDVNVLNRANEIGLTAGLAKGWQGIKEITRGEAAQILVNAMKAYLVEYGQLIKQYPEATDKTHPWKASFVSNEQVNKTGMRLAEKMGMKIVRMYDVFGRPGYKWSYKAAWSKFYMDAPLASFTTKTSACDILVGAGIAKNSTAGMKFDYFENGKLEFTKTYTHVGKACEANSLALGDTGALLQVFANGDNNVIVTRIDTYLTKVTNVNTNAKHGNLGGNSTLNIYFPLYANAKFDNNYDTYTVPGMTSYAKGSYILTHVSLLPLSTLTGTVYAGNVYTGDAVVETSATETASHTVYDMTIAYVVDVKAADSKAQKLTGRALLDTSMLTVDGEKTPTAAQYSLDEANVVANATAGNTYTFYRDQYNNLIGDTGIGVEYSYGVVTGIVWITNGASYSDAQFASAGFVNAGANEATDIKVVKAGNTDANVGDVYGTESNAQGSYMNRSVSTVKALNQDYTNNYNRGNKFGVVKYTESDGAYTLVYNDPTVEVLGVSGSWGLDISATKPQLSNGYVADENTIFTVRTTVAGKDVYTSYTGIKNVPTIKGATVVAVRESATSFVSFVYVDARNAIFAGSSTVAYVYAPTVSYEENGVYYTYNGLFIDGEKKSIDVPTDIISGDPAKLFANSGLYKLSFNADATKVIKVEDITATMVTDTIKSVSGYVVRATTDEAKSFNAENAKIYFLVKDTINGGYVDVEVKTVEDLAGAVGATFWYTSAAGNWNADVVYVEVAMD